MTAVDPKSKTASQPLNYAARMPAVTRTSRLAIASLVVALLSCPCLLGPFSKWVNAYAPAQLRNTTRCEAAHFWFIRSAMILATALPLAAILRILRSRRTRTGYSLSLVALLIALVWWGLAFVAYTMLSHWRMD